MFAPDLVGTSAQIAGALHAHAGYREVREAVFALPFTFAAEDHEQILTDTDTDTDTDTRLGPALGWTPRPRTASP